jgi:PAS domain S-box-containing protein
VREGDTRVLNHLDAQALFDAWPDAAVILDRAGRIRCINPSAQLLFQYEIDEIKGQPVEVLIPARFRIRHIADREILMRDGTVERWGPNRKLIALRKDGTECHVLVKLSRLSNSQADWLLCSLRELTDMSDLDRKVHDLHHQFQNLAWVLEAGEGLGSRAAMESFHEQMVALCMGTSYPSSSGILAKDLIEQIRRLSQPYIEHAAADLFIEEPCNDAWIQFRPSLLLMSLLGFIKICTEAVAPLGERWVKIGLELQEAKILISLSDSEFSISDDKRQESEKEFFVSAYLLKTYGAELLTSRTSASRFCVSVPARESSV